MKPAPNEEGAEWYPPTRRAFLLSQKTRHSDLIGVLSFAFLFSASVLLIPRRRKMVLRRRGRTNRMAPAPHAIISIILSHHFMKRPTNNKKKRSVKKSWGLKLLILIIFIGWFLGQFFHQHSLRPGMTEEADIDLHRKIRQKFSLLDRLFVVDLWTSDVIDREERRAFVLEHPESDGIIPIYGVRESKRYWPERFCQLGDLTGDWEISVHAYSWFGLLYKNYLFTCEKIDFSTRDGFGRGLRF